MFMCESSSAIGTGHVARSISLAEKFAQDNWQVTFCGGFDEPAWVTKLVSSIDKVVIVKASKRSEQILKHDVVVVDTYKNPTDKVNNDLIMAKYSVAIIDDNSPNIYADLYCSFLPIEYLSRFKSKQYALFGPNYALIRNDFIKLAARYKEKNKILEKDKTIALFFGGSNNFEIKNLFLKFLIPLMNGIKIKFFSDPVEFSSFKYDKTKIQFIQPSSAFHNELVDVDLIISPASVSSWEFIYTGIPTAIYVSQENQIGTYNFLTTSNMAFGLGSINSTSEMNINKLIFGEILIKLSENRLTPNISNQTLDGLGAKRVHEYISNNV